MSVYAFILCIVLCIDSGLAMGLSLVQGVLPPLQKMIMELRKRPRPSKGCRATGKKNADNLQKKFMETREIFEYALYRPRVKPDTFQIQVQNIEATKF
jgi:hypothetical protein